MNFKVIALVYRAFRSILVRPISPDKAPDGACPGTQAFNNPLLVSGGNIPATDACCGCQGRV